MKILSKTYIWIIFILLYAPIVMLVLFSFNKAGSLNHFSSFSLYWYRELFRDAEALKALKNSLILAVSSSLLATVIGTFAALGIDRSLGQYARQLARSDVYIVHPFYRGFEACQPLYRARHRYRGAGGNRGDVASLGRSREQRHI